MFSTQNFFRHKENNPCQDLEDEKWRLIKAAVNITKHVHVSTRNEDTPYDTTQKVKFSIKDFFSKCYQIRRFLPIWSHSV